MGVHLSAMCGCMELVDWPVKTASFYSGGTMREENHAKLHECRVWSALRLPRTHCLA